MSRHRLNVFITLVIVLLIIAGLSAWLTGAGSDAEDEPEESKAPATASVAPATSSPTPEESTAPSDEPEETDAPEESDDPSIPKTRTLNLSGDIDSTTGTNLNMSVKWTAVSKNDQTVTVTATAYIYSYAMQCDVVPGSISINGISKSFVSDSMSYVGTDRLQEVKLCTMSVDLPIAIGETVSIPVSAVWNYTGLYNDQQFDGISVDEYILIEG